MALILLIPLLPVLLNNGCINYINITNDLLWNLHIGSVTSKANQTLGYLLSNFSLAPMLLKLLSYATYARPKLEYASSISVPAHTTLIHSVEVAKNCAVHFILCSHHRTASDLQMKTTLGLPNVATRRENLRISLLHKIYHRNSTLHNSWICPAPYV